MKCKKCEMLNQQPETPCSHCGRMMPVLPKPITSTPPEKENAGNNEAGADGADNGEGAASSEAVSGAEEATTEEGISEAVAGHVDNVGDEAETETVA